METGCNSADSAKLERSNRPGHAVLLGVCATICWSYVNVLVEDNGAFDGAWMNGFICLTATIFNIPLFVLNERLGGQPLSQLSASVKTASIASSVFIYVGYLVVFIAMTDCPLGDVVALYNLNVVWTPIIESILMKKLPTKEQVLSLITALVGLLLLTRPSFIFRTSEVYFIQRYPNYKLAYLYSIFGSFCFAISQILVGFYPNVDWTVWQLGATPAAVFTIPVSIYIVNGFTILSKPSSLDIFGTIICGILDLLARIFSIFSIQEDTTTTTAISQSSEIPFSYFLGLIFLNEIPNVLSAVGALLICSAMFTLANVHLIIFEFVMKHKRLTKNLEPLIQENYIELKRPSAN